MSLSFSVAAEVDAILLRLLSDSVRALVLLRYPRSGDDSRGLRHYLVCLLFYSSAWPDKHFSPSYEYGMRPINRRLQKCFGSPDRPQKAEAAQLTFPTTPRFHYFPKFPARCMKPICADLSSFHPSPDGRAKQSDLTDHAWPRKPEPVKLAATLPAPTLKSQANLPRPSSKATLRPFCLSMGIRSLNLFSSQPDLRIMTP